MSGNGSSSCLFLLRRTIFVAFGVLLVASRIVGSTNGSATRICAGVETEYAARQPGCRQKETKNWTRHWVVQGKDLRAWTQGSKGSRGWIDPPHIRGWADTVFQAVAEARLYQQTAQGRHAFTQRRNHPGLHRHGSADHRRKKKTTTTVQAKEYRFGT